ncbi:putative ATP-dependent RNA helicase ste13 [Astathelohania contejeani]|uniref:ATP-dependent RNA helicase ste13 n=1 Tax=Astathelohania contejeani TaxID=164912 RepID=A0ABQ7I0N5_9MICR|nr:putative ATP-dependent RNA helicase ste13 [Thelohania contejeani]
MDINLTTQSPTKETVIRDIEDKKREYRRKPRYISTQTYDDTMEYKHNDKVIDGNVINSKRLTRNAMPKKYTRSTNYKLKEDTDLTNQKPFDKKFVNSKYKEKISHENKKIYKKTKNYAKTKEENKKEENKKTMENKNQENGKPFSVDEINKFVTNPSNKLEDKEELLKSLFEKLKIAESIYGIDILAPLSKAKEERSEDVRRTEGKTWKSFGLKETIITSIETNGFEYPSPVQVASIPPSLKMRNLVVRAKNGTGKTAAYIIPMLNKIDCVYAKPQSIILVPTRELALQVSRVCQKFGDSLNIQIMPTYGGTNLHEDILRMTNGIHVIVSTPGRVMDLAEKRVLSFDGIKTIILDEADKMLSYEFKKSLEKLLSFLPRNVQIEMYSATFPTSVQSFVERNMPDPIHLNLMKELTLKGVSQFYALVDAKDKLHCLKTLLMKIKLNQCVIFCNNIYNVELLAKKITNLGFPSYFIHSKMDQSERNTVFHNFTEGMCKILVSTDLVTRGIDVPTINCVINFDFPRTTESYLHRIGRSGRFGNIGLAVNLITEDDKVNLIALENQLETEILPVSHENFKEFMKKT